MLLLMELDYYSYFLLFYCLIMMTVIVNIYHYITYQLLVILSAVLLGVCGKPCPFSRERMFPQNVKLTLNTSKDQGYTMEEAVHLRSLSPWSYRMDEDHNRFPSVIPQAVCQHQWCLDAEGNVNNGMMSVPIQQEILVLRREIQDCHQNFFLEKQLVTVGCTCTTPTSQPA
uniref:Interleukin-17A/F1alpha n=1 Tax=Quasipaa spinosa TaxID=109965 RepID=A0A7S9CEA4_QUASP|nr:interleukin-17A/F1alpha [Quasipaa spinosa]